MPGKDFIGLLPTQDTRPKSGFFGPGSTVTLIRDNFSLSTWLYLGALIQGGLFWSIGRLSIVPVAMILLYRVINTYAMMVGFKENPHMKDIIPGKTSAQLPDELGHYGSRPANTAITVLLIGTRSNHPLGLLAPGMKESGAHFAALAKDLEDQAENFGFLGMTSWLSMSTRNTSSEIQYVCYFRNVQGLHAFSHDKLHREAWDWWNTNYKKHPHLSIYHETYDVPKGNWETIYVNSHPTGLGRSTVKITDEETGGEAYASPIVDASRGPLKTQAGRMNRSKGDENDKYGIPY